VAYFIGLIIVTASSALPKTTEMSSVLFDRIRVLVSRTPGNVFGSSFSVVFSI